MSKFTWSRDDTLTAMVTAPVLLFELTHSGCWTGGKPSTWFPPGGLVEQNFRARNFEKNWILNLILLILYLSVCLLTKVIISLKSWNVYVKSNMHLKEHNSIINSRFSILVFYFQFGHLNFECGSGAVSEYEYVFLISFFFICFLFVFSFFYFYFFSKKMKKMTFLWLHWSQL